jgi:hypothetical protein
MNTPRRVSVAGLWLVACTANPPVPQPAPVVETPVETPVVETPVVETPAVETPLPVIEAPPPAKPPMREPTKLTLHAVVLAEGGGDTEMDALPSGHVLFRDAYNFAVYPKRGAAETRLNPLPGEVLRPQFLLADDEDDEGEPTTTLEELHGAWPDHFYATTEREEMRATTQRVSLHWENGEWKAIPSPTADKPYTLSVTYERFLPWVKGRYLVERGLTCTEGCPMEEESYEDGEMSAADRKLEREIGRALDRWKPFAVVGGKATALPDLPDDAYAFQLISAASGDVFVPRRSGTVDRWNLTSKAWQSHAVPAGKYVELAATSTGAAYYSTCEPAYLGRLVDGVVTQIQLPEDGCIETLQVDGADRLWLVMRDPVIAAGMQPSRIWRREGDAWQRVELSMTLAGGPKRWSFDGLSWTEVEVPTGTFAVNPSELRVFGPDEVWVHGQLAGEGLAVLGRAEPGLVLPFDLRTEPPPFADVEQCVSQYIQLGTLPAGEEPQKAWPAAMKYLAELENDPPVEIDIIYPRVYEVDEGGQRVFFATLGETTEAGRKVIQEKLAAALPGVSKFECGRPPQPIREHDLPEVEEEPAAPEAKAETEAPETKAEAKAPETKAEAKAPETKAEAKAPETKAEAKAPETKAEAKQAPPALPGVLD